jgi:5-methylthioadenosine/S-adenosylhomocysteine deaminase
VTATDRTEPVAVDTVVTGEWIITLNAAREIYRDGAIAVSGGVITEVGKRAAILAKYRPSMLIDEPDAIVIPGMINGHRHLLCCAKGAMPEAGQTLSALRQFISPSFAALTEDDMHVYPVANIVYGSTGHSVDTVLIGGEVVLRHKQLTSLDEAGLRSQVEAINHRVLGEIGIARLPRWPIV